MPSPSYVLLAWLMLPLLVAGAVVGALVGTTVAVALKNRFAGIPMDALLGALGFVTVFFRWPLDRNYLGNAIPPYPQAFVGAIVLPLFHERYRRWRRVR